VWGCGLRMVGGKVGGGWVEGERCCRFLPNVHLRCVPGSWGMAFYMI
jgi:hypothetical protein